MEPAPCLASAPFPSRRGRDPTSIRSTRRGFEDKMSQTLRQPAIRLRGRGGPIELRTSHPCDIGCPFDGADRHHDFR